MDVWRPYLESDRMSMERDLRNRSATSPVECLFFTMGVWFTTSGIGLGPPEPLGGEVSRPSKESEVVDLDKGEDD